MTRLSASALLRSIHWSADQRETGNKLAQFGFNQFHATITTSGQRLGAAWRLGFVAQCLTQLPDARVESLFELNKVALSAGHKRCAQVFAGYKFSGFLQNGQDLNGPAL
jgi:hypothetical protein